MAKVGGESRKDRRRQKAAEAPAKAKATIAERK